MQWPIAITLSVLLAGQVVSAGLLSHDIPLRRDATTDRILRRRAASIVNADYVEKRAAVAGSTTASASEWNSQTEAACVSTLTSLAADQINESGMAVCYNLPTLDSTTGTFQADMRLYRVAAATGNFAGLSADGVQVQLSYSGAMVEPINSNQVVKREIRSMISWPATKRGNGLDSRATTPQMTQSYSFKGNINAASMTANMTDTDIQKLVLPTVTLSAMSVQNVPVFNTTLNSTQAAFLVGAFSGKAATTSSTGTGTAAAASNAGTTTTSTTSTTAAVAAADNAGTTTASASISKSTVFVMPGTKILIFPIGAIITGAWTVFFISTVMYGTLGRIQFRDQYRRQSARQNVANVDRI